MYIYNVTVHVDEKIHLKWLSWMREKHIADVLSTGKFSKALLTRVLTEEDLGGISYSVQYTAESRQALDLYHPEDAQRSQKRSNSAVWEQVLAFRTELKVIESFKTEIK
ncbi:MAG: DUF4286 family protein [Flavobacteriaceae bacterium]|nr:DUF4286 family protein [Flavobacteriaceae bacterium]